MLGLIVTGHGHFASGLTSSLELIAGDLQNYRAVDFEASDSVDDLRKKLEKAFDELKVQLTAAGYDKLIEEAKRQYAEYTAN